MGSIFRRRGERKYTIAWHDDTGRRRTWRVSSSRDVALQKLARIEREVERREAGLVDPYDAARRTPMSEHVDGYLRGIQAGNATVKHVQQTRRRLEAALAGMEATTLSALTLDRAERYLGALLQGIDGQPRVAAKTRDDIAAILKGFCEWLVDVERLPKNPLRRLRRIGRDTDRTFRRMALTWSEVEDLVEAAVTRPVQSYVVGHGGRTPPPAKLAELEAGGLLRARLYLYFAGTGPRHYTDARIVRWRDHDLDGELPSVTFPVPKNRTLWPVPLAPWLVALLRQMRAEQEQEHGGPVPPGARVFRRIPKNILEQLRKDAGFAGIAFDEFDRLDLHAFRASLETELERRNVPERIRDWILRHKPDRRIGARHYSRLGLRDAHRLGTDRLPVPHRALAAAGLTAPVTAALLSAVATDDSRRKAVGETEGANPLSMNDFGEPLQPTATGEKEQEWWRRRESNPPTFREPRSEDGEQQPDTSADDEGDPERQHQRQQGRPNRGRSPRREAGS